MRLLVSLVLACCSVVCLGQESESGRRMITKFSGYSFGVGYPYVTKSYNHNLTSSHFNIGTFGSFVFGRIYDSRIIISAQPTLLITSIGDTHFKSERFSSSTGNLYHQRKEHTEYKVLSLMIPVYFEFPILKKGYIKGAPYLSMTLAGGGYRAGFDKTYSPNGHYFEFANGFTSKNELTTGFISGIQFPVQKSEASHNYAGLFYHHEVSPAFQGTTIQKGFYLEFIHRRVERKEIREKWDRYLMRH